MAGHRGVIGVFDSGVGGLSVWRDIKQQLPGESIIYLADQANIPYGNKSAETIQTFSGQIVEFLLKEGAKVIVIACNTATALALDFLRSKHREVLFVGTEPAVKPASQVSRTGKVGVLATAGTFRSERYAYLTQQFAQEVQVYENPCHGLVEMIEAGDLQSPEVRQLLQSAIEPMVAQGVDTLVLGCTHYPFILPIVRTLLPENIRVIHPAPAVARRTKNILIENGALYTGDAAPDYSFLTTGDAIRFSRQIRQLLKIEVKVRKVTL